MKKFLIIILGLAIIVGGLFAPYHDLPATNNLVVLLAHLGDKNSQSTLSVIYLLKSASTGNEEFREKGEYWESKYKQQ